MSERAEKDGASLVQHFKDDLKKWASTQAGKTFFSHNPGAFAESFAAVARLERELKGERACGQGPAENISSKLAAQSEEEKWEQEFLQRQKAKERFLEQSGAEVPTTKEYVDWLERYFEKGVELKHRGYSLEKLKSLCVEERSDSKQGFKALEAAYATKPKSAAPAPNMRVVF